MKDAAPGPYSQSHSASAASRLGKSTGAQTTPTEPERDPDGRQVYFVDPKPGPDISNLSPVLEGRSIDLVTLKQEHFDALYEAGKDPEIFRFYTHSYHTKEAMRVWVDAAVTNHKAGKELAFVVFRKNYDTAGAAANARQINELVGSTRFLNYERSHRRLEIGSTWYQPSVQGSAVNSEAKLLLLSYAFEHLHCVRVEFKTDSFNLRSRAALKAIGAKEEGVFRNHMITASGRLRHSVYFSITLQEWPEVKKALAERIARLSQNKSM